VKNILNTETQLKAKEKALKSAICLRKTESLPHQHKV
jgi:hypothetical protein